MNQRFPPRIKDCAQGGSNKNAAGARGKQWKLGPGPLAGSSSRCLFGLGWRWTRPETDLSRSYMIVYDRIADNMQQPNKYEVSMGFNLCQPSHGSYMIWQYMTSMLWLHVVATCCDQLPTSLVCSAWSHQGYELRRITTRRAKFFPEARKELLRKASSWTVLPEAWPNLACCGQVVSRASSPFFLYPSAVSCLLRFLGAKWYLLAKIHEDTMEI